MGQTGLLVTLQVKRIVEHAGISPSDGGGWWGELDSDLWQLLLTWWPRVNKSLLRVSAALGHLLVVWWPPEV